MTATARSVELRSVAQGLADTLPTTIEEVAVNGHRGWWISGEPHIFFFLGTDGEMRQETMRLATNTLLLDINGTIVRIEGNLTKRQALDLAASLS